MRILICTCLATLLMACGGNQPDAASNQTQAIDKLPSTEQSSATEIGGQQTTLIDEQGTVDQQNMPEVAGTHDNQAMTSSSDPTQQIIEQSAQDQGMSQEIKKEAMTDSKDAHSDSKS
ncbi:hypothetical protein [Kaarinaea lacus]